MAGRRPAVPVLRHQGVRFTVKPPRACPQCGSIVWDGPLDYWEDFLTPARCYRCPACGHEVYQEVHPGGLVDGQRPARCRCCHRVLGDPVSAVEGLGPECRKGTCGCHERRFRRAHGL